MDVIVQQMECLMTLRERTMHMCTRPPATVLECGVYRSDAPAPAYVLPFDRCNIYIFIIQFINTRIRPPSSGIFAVYGTDGAHFTLNLRLDKSAKDICQAAVEKISLGACDDGIELVELKSNGGNKQK